MEGVCKLLLSESLPTKSGRILMLEKKKKSPEYKINININGFFCFTFLSFIKYVIYFLFINLLIYLLIYLFSYLFIYFCYIFVYLSIYSFTFQKEQN